MADQAYITLYRKPAWYEHITLFPRALNVLIDNNKVDNIYPDKQKLLEVTPGNHIVVVKPWFGAGTKKVEINLLAGNKVSLECGWSDFYIRSGVTCGVVAFVIIGILILLCQLGFINNSNLSSFFGMFLGIGFIAIWSAMMISGLIGLCKPGYAFYLKESNKEILYS